jgi:hypothetical protein
MITIIWIMFWLMLYFTPTFVAVNKKHRNTSSIFVLNLFLGFTLLFWVIALVWAYHK